MSNPRLLRSYPFVCLLASLPLFLGAVGCGAGSNSVSSGTTTGSTSTTPAVAPTVTSIMPSVLMAGAGPTTLTVTGTNFTAGTVVQVGGVPEPTSYASATQVTAIVPAAQLAAGGMTNVVAVNGSVSSASGATITLEVDNPAPKIASIVPATLAAGGLARSVSITGTGFVSGTTIQVNGSARSTEYIVGTQVNVILTPADLATAGSLSLTAVNAAPGGGTSPAASVAINNPVPLVSSVAPNVILAGTVSPTTVTVAGAQFVASSVVQLSGSPRPTTYVSSTQLTFQMTPGDQATPRTLSVGVVTAAPGGGTSSTLGLAVAAQTATPVISSVSPTSFLVASGDASLQVAGTNFGTVNNQNFFLNPPITYPTVLWNGIPLATSYYNTNGFNVISLVATVPASLLASVGTANITVSSPLSTPAISNSLPVTIANPPVPVLTGISPSGGPINTAATVTLSGTGFTPTSTVAFNGTSLPATFGNSGTLTVTLPASSVPLPGNGTFTVTTPAPGGGTAASLPYTAYVALANNSMVYNPRNGLLYLSVPSSAGAPYGNAIVPMDPATGALGTPIPAGSEPNRLALTSDGLFLWVGLDGASAVRKVDLTTGVAGLQFPLGGNPGINGTLPTASALAALPGASNSVVVAYSAYYNTSTLAIFDTGTVRGTPVPGTFNSPFAQALQVDGTRGEVYAAASNTYMVYSYNANGLTLKASATNGNYASSSSDDLQLANGSIYTDFGKIYDAEAGALLGTFYATPAVLAAGPTIVDTTLGKAFVLDNPSTNSYPYIYTQIQSFSTANFTTATGSIPVIVQANNVTGNTTTPSKLTRWGTNGLAFRTNLGVYSFRSNLVKDLSAVSTDLGIAVVGSGSNATGATSTYTAKVTNAGPAAATNVVLTALVPSTGSLVSAASSVGTCSTANGVACDLGGLANGATATVTMVVTQTTAGPAVLTAQVTGSETDPNLANNQASVTATVTGSAFALPPTLTAISPAAIRSGVSDTTITLTGTGFTSGSVAQLGGISLATSYVSPTAVTAIVPAANLVTLGWAPVTVTTPAPGGGTTPALPLTVYSVLTVGVNHMVYDPYTRKIMASIGSGSSTIAGNSIAAITPETATIGTPVNIGSQPASLALTSDGKILYVGLNGSQSVARFNMLTQAPDFTVAIPALSTNTSGPGLRSIATLPGTENTVALDLGVYSGNALYDFNPANMTAAIRGTPTGYYGSPCLQFLDPNNLLALDGGYTASVLDHYPVTPNGLGTDTTSTLDNFGCFKVNAGLAYASGGGVANAAGSPAVQLGTFPLPPATFNAADPANVAPDSSLHRTFFAINSLTSYCCTSIFDSIESFNNDTYLPATLLPFGFASVEGAGTTFTVQDLVRWGQDGLAVLTSGGHIYLLRGPVVTPQLLSQNTAATLTVSSSSAITHGAGNTLLTLTGTNFVPGVAVTWNGSYRTTTILDATHVTVAIPASDLAAAGTGSLVAINPGAAASSALTVTVN